MRPVFSFYLLRLHLTQDLLSLVWKCELTNLTGMETATRQEITYLALHHPFISTYVGNNLQLRLTVYLLTIYSPVVTFKKRISAHSYSATILTRLAASSDIVFLCFQSDLGVFLDVTK